MTLSDVCKYIYALISQAIHPLRNNKSVLIVCGERAINAGRDARVRSTRFLGEVQRVASSTLPIARSSVFVCVCVCGVCVVCVCVLCVCFCLCVCHFCGLKVKGLI